MQLAVSLRHYVLTTIHFVVLAGVTIGLVAAFFAVRMMAALLYGLEARDLATFFIVPIVLALAASLATIAPALRATRVSPIVAIRSD
jgi:hypothetical protein